MSNEKIDIFFNKHKKIMIGVIVAFVIVFGISFCGLINIILSDQTKNKDVDKVQNESVVEMKKIDFEIGDYVKMTPSKDNYTLSIDTGFGYKQTINPSKLNLWRVIKINEDNSIELVSEYVSKEKVFYNGSSGYENYIASLNEIAKAYENEQYTVGSRYVGYDGTQTEKLESGVLYSSTAPQLESTSASNVTAEKESKGLGDVGYKKDTDLIKKALGTLMANGSYYLASREYEYIEPVPSGASIGPPFTWAYCVRYVSSGYNDEGHILIEVQSTELFDYLINGNGSNRHYTGESVRPIVILKSGLETDEGDGTEKNPYVLK